MSDLILGHYAQHSSEPSSPQHSGDQESANIELQPADRPLPLSELKKIPSMRVLLIDDHQDVLDTMSMLLTMVGHKVAVAIDAHQGLEQALSGKFDVAVIDIGLPQMNGFEIAKKIRANSRTSKMILIALSGYAREKDQQTALQSGFNLHLSKPVSVETLTRSFIPDSLKSRVSEL